MLSCLEMKMSSYHKPRVFRSVEGCCICKAKSSRWTLHAALHVNIRGGYTEHLCLQLQIHWQRKVRERLLRLLQGGGERAEWGHLQRVRAHREAVAEPAPRHRQGLEPCRQLQGGARRQQGHIQERQEDGRQGGDGGGEVRKDTEEETEGGCCQEGPGSWYSGKWHSWFHRLDIFQKVTLYFETFTSIQ